MTCVAQTRHAALSSIESRIEKLRNQGWELPQDAYVEIRPSGFGYAASLILPERCRNGRAFQLRRWVTTGDQRRTKSDTYPVFPLPGVVHPSVKKRSS